MRKKEPCFLSFPAARPVSPQSSAFLLLSRTFLFDSQHAPTFYIPPRRAPRSYGTACRRPAADDFVKTRCAPNFPPRTLERKKNRFLARRETWRGGIRRSYVKKKAKKMLIDVNSLTGRQRRVVTPQPRTFPGEERAPMVTSSRPRSQR